MEASLSFTVEEQNVLKQLYLELKIALTSCSLRDYSDIFIDASSMALKTTAKSKYQIGKTVVKTTIGIFRRYHSNGFSVSLKSDANKAKSKVENLPTKISSIYYEFYEKSNEEKANMLASTILFAGVTFAFGGGADFEGGIPDLDTQLAGIGAHRNVFTHSIFIGLTSEFVLRLSLGVLSGIYVHFPNPHHKIWDAINKFIIRNQDLAIRAMWIGIGMHLIQDAGLFASSTKPYVGLPGGLPMEVHQSIFAGNGAASVAFGTIKPK